ncbi:sperm-associated microtubule inner protein 10-like [Babylonia areolata]|uniref:sperm-associated microtubule inner protein 10-like n=1 Tax=Babylonia areolata TaxID=304850 RepID=UPI003FD40871
MERTDMAAKTDRGDPGSLKFGRNLYTHSCVRVPQYSRLHPVIPRLYVQEWKMDMKNRELITQNARLGGIPNFEHDENLFLEKREQMYYNVEDANRVINKYKIPERAKLLRPDFHSEMSRYQSELMCRRDEDTV